MPSYQLPHALSSFVGRETEIRQVSEHLAQSRLVTLTGGGGCGKTRLALHVAMLAVDDFTDGMWLLDLAALSQPELVSQQLAVVLGVREQQDQPLLTTLAHYLRDKRALLIFDNCERVVDACAELADALLRSCSQLRVLATSREALNLFGESVVLVPPLRTPPRMRVYTPKALMQYEAVRLFVERARAIQPDFKLSERDGEAVAQICQRLDGIPLAIELAAARVKALSVQQIATLLDDRFRLLVDGRRTDLPHHQTLRATMQWSYELLLPAERLLFKCLAVFAGGWTLEAAEAICANHDGPRATEGIEPAEILTVLAQLVNKSLVIVTDRGQQTRYRMLETVRQFAHELLEKSAEATALCNAHLRYFQQLAQTIAPWLRSAEQNQWLNRIAEDHDNFRAALEWSLEQQAYESTLELASALWWFWWVQNYFSEGRRWLERALSAGVEAPPALRANALQAAGYLSFIAGDYGHMRTLLQESLALCEAEQDRRGVAWSLDGLALATREQGDFARASALQKQSLDIWRALDDRWHIGYTLGALGRTALAAGDDLQAAEYYQASLDLRVQIGDRWGVAVSLEGLARVAHHRGDLPTARNLFLEALHQFAAQEHQFGIMGCLAGIVGIAVAARQFPHAARLAGAIEALFLDAGFSMLYNARAEYDPLVEQIVSELDAARLEAEWASGRVLTLEQAIAEAEWVGAHALDLSAQTDEDSNLLTEREAEVLRWVAQGLTDQEVAARLVISPRTVQSHLRSIYSKLGVTTRAAATRHALENHIV